MANALQNPRHIPDSVVTQLCSNRLTAYRNELRGLANSTSSEPEPEPGPGPSDDRPYGVPRNVQGVVEDVWPLILDKVTDPQSIIILSGMSEWFRHILRRKYVQARLPEVLEIIFRRNLDMRGGADVAVAGPVRFPPLSRYFRLRMKLRLVSKTTKNAIEAYKEWSEAEHWNAREENLTLYLRRPDKIEKLVREMDQIPNFRNDGFFPNRIEVDDSWLPRRTNIEGLILPVLQRIGRSVKRLRYETAMRKGCEPLYSCLIAWTTDTPNLEELEVTIPHDPNEEDEEEGLEDPRPFPTIPTLKKYADDTNIPRNIRERILQANPTIKSVTLGTTSPDLIFISNEVWGNLKIEELRLRCALPTSLLEYRPLQWPLRVLGIDDLGRGRLQTQELFGFLNQFKTLEQLEFFTVVEDNGGMLELPNVRRFTWSLHPSLENMDFIIPLEKLEQLHLYFEDENWRDPNYFSEQEIQRERQEILEIFKGLRNDNFEDTNVKAIFPRLETLLVNFEDKSFRS